MDKSDRWVQCYETEGIDIECQEPRGAPHLQGAQPSSPHSVWLVCQLSSTLSTGAQSLTAERRPHTGKQDSWLGARTRLSSRCMLAMAVICARLLGRRWSSLTGETSGGATPGAGAVGCPSCCCCCCWASVAACCAAAAVPASRLMVLRWCRRCTRATVSLGGSGGSMSPPASPLEDGDSGRLLFPASTSLPLPPTHGRTRDVSVALACPTPLPAATTARTGTLATARDPEIMRLYTSCATRARDCCCSVSRGPGGGGGGRAAAALPAALPLPPRAMPSGSPLRLLLRTWV